MRPVNTGRHRDPFVFVLVAALLQALLGLPALSQTSCSQAYPPRYRVAYDDGVTTSVIGPPSISQPLTAVATVWNSTCQFAEMPPLTYVPGLDRSPGDTTTNSVVFTFSNGLGPQLQDGSYQLAQ